MSEAEEQAVEPPRVRSAEDAAKMKAAITELVTQVTRKYLEQRANEYLKPFPSRKGRKP